MFHGPDGPVGEGSQAGSWATKMAWHRKIDVRMYGDAKYCALSKPLPNAQTLWIHLLTGPHTTSLPGLSQIGLAALSEALGFPKKSLLRCFAELNEQKISYADWNARVVWVPNCIKYNPPENPNVVKSWAHYWDVIPECPLKVKAFLHYSEYFKNKQAFHKAFRDTFGEHYRKGMANQEQEQEQEQEQDSLEESLSLPNGIAVLPFGGFATQEEFDSYQRELAETKADLDREREAAGVKL